METTAIPVAPVQTAPQVNTPVVNFTSAEAIAQEQMKADADAKAAELAKKEADGLLSYLNKCLNDAVQAKQLNGITDRLLDAQRRRRGQHSAEKMAQLKKYGLPDYWVPLTQTKCIHTEAWLRDILMPYGDRIWRLLPTEIPELEQSIKDDIMAKVMEEAQQFIMDGGMVSDQQIHNVREKIEESYKKASLELAREKAENMESKIIDQHEECNFTAIFREFQSNLTTYGTAFIRGPFTVMKKSPKWKGDKRVVEDKIIPSCSAPSPHDIFPAPWAKNEQDGYIIERIKTYRKGLQEVMDLPYYVKDNIQALLKDSTSYSNSTIQYGDYQRYTQEDKMPTPIDDRIELYLFTGPVAGNTLNSWGLKDYDPSLDYDMEVLWSRNYVLKVMPRWDEASVRGYFKAVFKQMTGSFWGIGVPHLMSASQDRANSMMIALLDNCTWGTGFVGWINQNRLVNLDDVKEMHSKKWIPVQASLNAGDNGPPMGIVDFNLRAGELSALYEKCLQDADNESGVPAYMYGSGQGGPAAGTYSGLQTLMNASARGIKDCILEIDQAMKRFISHWADWNMEYLDDETIKGDIRVVCSGSTGLFVMEAQLDRIDSLIAQASPYIPVTGPEFVLSCLRQKAHALRVDTSFLPTDEDLAAMKSKPPEAPQNPLKPSLSVSAKLELLPPEIQMQLLSQVGVEPPAPPQQQAEAGLGLQAPQAPQAPQLETGTPANMETGDQIVEPVQPQGGA